MIRRLRQAAYRKRRVGTPKAPEPEAAAPAMEAATPPGAGALPSATTDCEAPLPMPPPASGDREEMNRRLSLDGDLPEQARRPDQDPAAPADPEGLVRVEPHSVIAHMDVAGCSEAGWEPARPDPNATHQQVLEVRKENQDAYAILAPFARHTTLPALGAATSQLDDAHMRHVMFLGVFDGHGAEGRTIAHFVRDHIARKTLDMAGNHPGAIADSAPAAGAAAAPHVDRNMHRIRMETLRSAFSRAERDLTDESNRIDHLFSGTTAVVSWMFRDDVYTAWAGDSRCVVGRAILGEEGRTKYQAVDLSHDQKPSRQDEKKRVKQAGGRIARWRRNIGPLRVWLPRDWIPGLAMTRSIGDTVLSEYGVSPVPEVTYTRLCSADAFMVLASDGVWEFMTSQEVVDFVGKKLADGASAAETSTALVREAVRKWRRNEVVVDDTTAVVMHLRVNGERSTGASSETNGLSGGRENVDANGVANGGVEPLPAGRGMARLEKSMLAKKVLAMGRGKQGRARASANGCVSLVGDDGRLLDFYCRNDLNNGA